MIKCLDNLMPLSEVDNKKNLKNVILLNYKLFLNKILK